MQLALLPRVLGYPPDAGVRIASQSRAQLHTGLGAPLLDRVDVGRDDRSHLDAAIRRETGDDPQLGLTPRNSEHSGCRSHVR